MKQVKCKCGCPYWYWIKEKFYCMYCMKGIEDSKNYKYDYINQCLWEVRDD